MIENLFSVNATSMWLAIAELADTLLGGLCLMFCWDVAAAKHKLEYPELNPEDRHEIETAQTALFTLGVMLLGWNLYLLSIEGNLIFVGLISTAAGLAVGACIERAIWLASRSSRESEEPEGHGLRYLISFRWLL
jgi:hypothetical protein